MGCGMVEERETGTERAPNPLKQFFLDIAKGLRGGAVAWISAGILGAMVAGGTYYYHKLRDTAKEVSLSRTNMGVGEAWAEARRSIGSRTLGAIPFRNRDDPTQYIAVWYTAPDDEPACPQDPCLDALGKTKVDLLVGNGGLFERASTGVTAGPDFAISVEDKSPAERAHKLAQFGGVTDWNGDGVREIFSIAVTSSTAPTQYTILSIFDTKSRRLQQLQMASSRTTDTPTFIGNPNPQLRAWLGQRYKELDWESQSCTRKLSGELQCRGGAALDPTTESTDEEIDLASSLMDAWIVEHGSDFVSGQLRLQFKPGLVDAPNDVCFDDGRYLWVNMFKGPLVVNDRRGNRSAVAYVQDGDHHREIPTIIRGRNYVWLSLAVKRQLLAIDTQTWRVERVEVPEWAGGIPDPYEPGKMIEQTPTKDQQVYPLEVSDGRLVYSGQPLTLIVNGQQIDQASEFSSARVCDHWSVPS